MEKMYVICFYWEGDRWQSNPDPDSMDDPQYKMVLKRAGGVSLELASRYVNNLYRGVKKYATREFDFICFTNEPLKLDKSIEKRAFPLHTKRGVLPRVYMFSSEAGLENRQVLCLDLDVIIVGSMEGLMAYDGMFCARSKFRPGQEDQLDGDIMSFRAGRETEERFWDPFIEDVAKAEKITNGRERYWVRHCALDIADRWEQVAPGAVLSYKRHIRHLKHVPKVTSIVSCHGIPRPHMLSLKWLQKYWEK